MIHDDIKAKGLYFAFDADGELWCIGQCGDDESASESAADMIQGPFTLMDPNCIPEQCITGIEEFLSYYDVVEEVVDIQ